MLMQEFIKKMVINIHKCNFFMWACGPTCMNRGPTYSPLRAYAGLQAHYSDPLPFSFTGLRANPTGQIYIVIPNYDEW